MESPEQATSGYAPDAAKTEMGVELLSRKSTVLSELRKARGERVASWDLTVAGGGTAVHSRVAELRNDGYDIVCEQEVIRGERIYFYRILEPEQREAKRLAEARQVGLW